MKRLGLLVIGLVLLAAAGRAEETNHWKVVCDQDDLTAESRCYLSFFTEDKALGTWLGIAVQRLNGWHEIQVNSSGGSVEVLVVFLRQRCASSPSSDPVRN